MQRKVLKLDNFKGEIKQFMESHYKKEIELRDGIIQKMQDELKNERHKSYDLE